MAKSVSVEESIFKQKINLAKLGHVIKDIDTKKNSLHKTIGAWSPETNKLHKQLSGLKIKERYLESNLAKSESFLKTKQAKKPKAKKHKSFSEHLFSKIG